jgi:DNA-binding Lrp family transcriptional regulator
MPLDRIDLAIIAALQANARLSNKELAARVDLAPSTCLERVRRLVATGVLRGFHADVDPRAVGIGLQALVTVWMRQHSSEAVDAFRAWMLSRSEIVAIYHTAGSYDFLVHVAVRDADHLREITLHSFLSRPEVRRIETSLIFESRVKPLAAGDAWA